MKKIDNVLEQVTGADLLDSVQQAAQFAQIESALRWILSDEGFGEIDCRVLSLQDGELFVGADNAPAVARLRQMQRALSARLRRRFMQIKYLRFGIQP